MIYIDKMEASDSIKILRNKISNATSRLKQDYLRLKADPVPYIIAEPLPSNLLEWHFVLRGPEQSPFEGGFYHGKLIFPREFPFRPPSIYMITPNGRFKTNTRLCLSISDFHPDTWNPAWSVSTILTGLLSFMLEKTPTMGSLESSDYVKRQLAVQSLEENLKHRTFCELFPEIMTEINEALRLREEALKEEAVCQSSNASRCIQFYLGLMSIWRWWNNREKLSKRNINIGIYSNVPPAICNGQNTSHPQCSL